MSNPTSNFGWQMPTPTDLVTDLPADFEVFGQAVDTSMADLKGGTTGQILSKATNTDMDFVWIANDQGDITGVTATSPLTGGGTSGAITVGIQDASTSQKGSVQLSDSTSTTSSILAATPTAVKSAYDLAAAAIPKSTVTAKGSIVAATGSSTPANLSVGNNGETLVADSSTSTGLRYTQNFAAGKNKIINGDFGVNQRSFTSTTGQGVFGFDRFAMDISANTCTYSAQVFTPGTAPVAGYEGTNYARFVTAAQDATTGYSIFWQRIEDARTFAGQTATFSVWAKAASGTPKIALEIVQKFGSGGSTEVQTYAGQITLSTSWARYSITVAIPSVSGKTIGSGSSLAVNLWLSAGTTYNSRTGSLGVQNNTLELWGLQLEAGSVATAFQTATGTIQGELAACQRYFQTYVSPPLRGAFGGTTGANRMGMVLPVVMRTAPSASMTGTLDIYDGTNLSTFTALGGTNNKTTSIEIDATAANANFAQYRNAMVIAYVNTGSVNLSSEL